MDKQELAMLLGRVQLGGLRCDSILGELMQDISCMCEGDFLALCKLCGDDVATVNALCNLRSLGHYAGYQARGAQ